MVGGRLSDEEWAFFEPFVTESGPLRGRPPRDHRRTLDAIFWITRTGAPWRDLPEELGNWNSVHQPVPPLDREWALGPDAGRSRRGWWRRHPADDRQHHRPGTPLRSGRKGGAQSQALGRSRGGFSTKIHLRTNAEGLPIGLLLSPGEAHDSTAYADLMAEHDVDPEVLLADRGYDSDAIREDVRARRGRPEIPTRKNRRVQQAVDRALYALRNRIERLINRLNNSRRVATRYDHTASSLLGFTTLDSIRQWIRFVHAT